MPGVGGGAMERMLSPGWLRGCVCFLFFLRALWHILLGGTLHVFTMQKTFRLKNTKIYVFIKHGFKTSRILYQGIRMRGVSWWMFKEIGFSYCSPLKPWPHMFDKPVNFGKSYVKSKHTVLLFLFL